MSSDGLRVFFLEGGDLHLCEIVEGEGEISCRYSDLTEDHRVGEGAAVQGLVSGVSSDGSYVYFVARGVLGDAPVGASGEDNLYLLRDAGGVLSTSFIASLSRGDEKSWDLAEGNRPPDLSRISSRVSEDGRFFVFMSDRPLTGYDNTDVVSGMPDEEVFLYRAAADPASEQGRLVCVSCDPTGARPAGVFDQPRGNRESLQVDRQRSWGGSWLAGIVPGWDNGFDEGSRYQPRFLSDSGRVFFESTDGLVPRATNGLEDVYEYEPAGVGGCTESGESQGSVVFSPVSGGCVGLVSSGIAGQESTFFDASENGDDAFFITAAKLVGTDHDNGYDVYDAHVCGAEGVSCASEPVQSSPCSSGDSCKAAPSPQSTIFGAPPSATFSGAGNVIEETKGKTTVKHKKRKKPPVKKKKKRKGRKARVGGGRGGVTLRSGRGRSRS
jgi:hypothetical protein